MGTGIYKEGLRGGGEGKGGSFIVQYGRRNRWEGKILWWRRAIYSYIHRWSYIQLYIDGAIYI